jgi:hypothetical protein
LASHNAKILGKIDSIGEFLYTLNMTLKMMPVDGNQFPKWTGAKIAEGYQFEHDINAKIRAGGKTVASGALIRYKMVDPSGADAFGGNRGGEILKRGLYPPGTPAGRALSEPVKDFNHPSGTSPVVFTPPGAGGLSLDMKNPMVLAGGAAALIIVLVILIQALR